MLQQLIQENQGGKGLFLLLSVFITLSFAFVAAHPCGTCRSAGFPGGVNGRTCRCGKAQKSKYQKNSLF